MAEVILTPSGHPRWRAQEGDPAVFTTARDAFARDWREGLFVLAAEKVESAPATGMAFWRSWAQRYLTRLCHIPSSANKLEVDRPSGVELAQTILSAPPMTGGEYLTDRVLEDVWEQLHAWTVAATGDYGGLGELLEARAPKWHQVGRVCFHLAENKQDPDRPFAFMATFSTGFGAGGKLKHLPLRRALEQYAGAKNRPALVKLLEPIQAAAKRCDWIADMVEDQSVFSPMALSPNQAHRFLTDAEAMEEAGLAVRLPDWWKKRPRPQVAVTIDRRTNGASAPTTSWTSTSP